MTEILDNSFSSYYTAASDNSDSDYDLLQLPTAVCSENFTYIVDEHQSFTIDCEYCDNCNLCKQNGYYPNSIDDYDMIEDADLLNHAVNNFQPGSSCGDPNCFPPIHVDYDHDSDQYIVVDDDDVVSYKFKLSDYVDYDDFIDDIKYTVRNHCIQSNCKSAAKIT